MGLKPPPLLKFGESSSHLGFAEMGNWRTREGGLQSVAGLNRRLIDSDS